MTSFLSSHDPIEAKHYPSPRTKQIVALKILTADSYGGKKDTYELDILNCISEKSRHDQKKGRHVLGLLDQFQHDGPHGRHVCLVFKAMGPDLGWFRNMFPRRRLPVPIAKKVTRDLVTALVFIHDECSVIHTGKWFPHRKAFWQQPLTKRQRH